MNTLPALRRRMRAQRRALDTHTRADASAAMGENLLALSLFRASRRVAAFWSHDGEPDMAGLIERLWALRKSVFLPVLTAPCVNHLRFAPYHRGALLSKNVFGIPEPLISRRQWVLGTGLDLVLVPLVAFDREGHRLGMGRGYYDRTFAFLRYRSHWFKPRLVGVAYEFQKVEELRTHYWDVPLDAIITERTVYAMERNDGNLKPLSV